MNPDMNVNPPSSEATSLPIASLASHLNSSESIEREYQQLWKHFLARSLANERQYFTHENYPVRIVELLVLTSLVSFGLVLIRHFEIVGTLICFLTASMFSLVAPSLMTNANRVRFWNQTLWGILVPLAAVMGDPFVFGRFQGGVPIWLNQQWCPGTYFVLAISFLLLVFSWFLRPESYSWINVLVAGQLRCSAFILFLIGFALLPIAILGSLSLLGMVALVPWITGAIYYRTSRMHSQWGRAGGKFPRLAYLLGFVSIGFPFVSLTILGSLEFFSQFTWY